MPDIPNTGLESFSDDALVARLYEMAAQMMHGNPTFDRNEMTRIDAVVYRRLAQSYSKDPHETGPPPATRLDS